MVQYVNCLGLRKEHSSFWDVLEVMIGYNMTVGDSMVFSWSFPNDFFFPFSDYQVWTALCSLSWPQQNIRFPVQAASSGERCLLGG